VPKSVGKNVSGNRENVSSISKFDVLHAFDLNPFFDLLKL